MFVVCLEVLEDYASNRHDRLRMNSLRNRNGLAPAFFVCVPLALPRKTGWQTGASDTKKAEQGTTRVMVVVLAFPVHFQGCVLSIKTQNET